MRSCGFEFGFDDSSLASNEALEGIVLNWDRWRLKVIDKNKHAKQSLETLEHNLEQIGSRLAFDLIPVKIDGSTEEFVRVCALRASNLADARPLVSMLQISPVTRWKESELFTVGCQTRRHAIKTSDIDGQTATLSSITDLYHYQTRSFSSLGAARDS
jgi:hypothetical protein